jgi:hypothetical protein
MICIVNLLKHESTDSKKHVFLFRNECRRCQQSLMSEAFLQEPWVIGYQLSEEGLREIRNPRKSLIPHARFTKGSQHVTGGVYKI